VLSGVWLSALGVATFANNELDGLILDTTFNVIRQYHPAILLAIIVNVRLPLVFSVALPESIELYDHFQITFRDEAWIDVTRSVRLSDHGAALNAIRRRRALHLFCLRQLLQTLSKYRCRQAIGIW
jgi:hypothetical protein